MSRIEDVDLSEAVKMYAISNTPLFLMKRLREITATTEISRSFSGDEILMALKNLVNVNPKSSSDYVRPYVYLLALSQLSENRFLEAAVNIPERERWDWFDYIGRVLVETYSSAAHMSFDAHKPTLSPSIKGSDAVDFNVFEFSGRH